MTEPSAERSSTNPPAWSGLGDACEVLDPAARAPVTPPDETPQAYRRALELLVGELDVPPQTIDLAMASGAALLYRAQEFVTLANRLVSTEATSAGAQAALLDLLRSFMGLKQERPAAYAVEQVASALAAGQDDASRILERGSRLKDFMSPLEEFLDSVGVPRKLEAPRLAAFLVHMDDLYDDAAAQLQTIFSLARMELPRARSLAPEFLSRLYREFARASLADHVLAEHQGGKGTEKGTGTGLLVLVPEIIAALE